MPYVTVTFAVRMDLIYEGITTLAYGLGCCLGRQNGPDLRRDYD